MKIKIPHEISWIELKQFTQYFSFYVQEKNNNEETLLYQVVRFRGLCELRGKKCGSNLNNIFSSYDVRSNKN